MLIIPQSVKVKWHNRTIKWYTSFGYKYTKLWDEFDCDVVHLSVGYFGNVIFLCDYCDEKFIRPFSENITKTRTSITKKDCCGKNECTRKKIDESIMEKYDKASIFNVPHVRASSLDVIKYDKEVVRSKFLEASYILEENIYVDSNTAMKCRCIFHPEKISYVTLSNVIQGKRCKYCFFESISGENNCNWKGGISSITNYLRATLIDWKKLSMVKSDYKCVLSGDKFDNIHHLYSFDLILEEVFFITGLKVREKINDYSSEELSNLTSVCIDIHKDYPLGVCLRKDIHNLFHHMYGYGNNTPEQFEEFKLNYKNSLIKVS